MTDETLVSQIDDFLGELETDLATILGFTLDSDITVSAFSCDNSGRLTKDLIRWVHETVSGLDPLALSITNSTNAVESRVGLLGVQATQNGAPIGLLHVLGIGGFSAANVPPDLGTVYDRDATLPGFAILTGGALWGYLFTAAARGLIRKGSGNTDEYLNSSGLFLAIDRPSQTVFVTTPLVSGSSTFTGAAEHVPFWNAETFDTDGLHAASDDELIVVQAGTYLFGANIITDTVLGTGDATLTLYRSRAAVVTQWGKTVVPIPSDGGTSMQCEAMVECQAGDTLYVSVNLDDDRDDPYVVSSLSNLWAARIA